MFGIESLDVMIGIMTIYLMFALACTATVEAFSAWFNLRSKNLEAALEGFLHGELKSGINFKGAFFKHPLVGTLSRDADGKFSYINPETVGRVVADLLDAKEGVSTLTKAINEMPGTIHDNRIKGLLDALHQEAQDDVATFRKLVESHFDAVMDRASGWYKKRTQSIALVVAAIFVLFANVDTISLANSLSSNPSARAKMVEIAQRQVDTAKETAARSNIPVISASSPAVTDSVKEAMERSERAAAVLAKANSDLASAGIQLGWKEGPASFSNWVSKITGLLISILAISLGAPFWFDMLGRVMKVRAAGESPRDKKPVADMDKKTGT